MFVDDYVSRYIEITGDTLVSDKADTALFSKLDPEKIVRVLTKQKESMHHKKLASRYQEKTKKDN